MRRRRRPSLPARTPGPRESLLARVFKAAAASVAAVACLGLGACEESPAARPGPNASARGEPPRPGVEVRAAPEGPLATVLEREQRQARAEGRTLLVYVGATWCEPCQYFKEAVKKGHLDAEFPNLRLVELDRDRDESRLAEVGCLSRMIPLLARVEGARCSAEARMEGSIKGPGAVAEMTPRLRALLAAR